MRVIFANGNVWNPIVVLLGNKKKFCYMADLSIKTPRSYLPANAYVTDRDPAGVDTEIFVESVGRFVNKTAAPRLNSQ